MMKTDTHQEIQAEKIQKMPLKQWKAIAKNAVFLMENADSIPIMEEDDSVNEMEKETIATNLQNLSLRNLRSLVITERTTNNPTLAEKVLITGLPQEVIQKLETHKEKATLEEIITYCKRLQIPFQAFLPELFVM